MGPKKVFKFGPQKYPKPYKAPFILRFDSKDSAMAAFRRQAQSTVAEKHWGYSITWLV